MQIRDVVEKAKLELGAIIGMPISGVTGGEKMNDGWHVTIEVIERKAVPDAQDLLGVYEVVLDVDGDLINYERKRMRHRADLEEVIE